MEPLTVQERNEILSELLKKTELLPEEIKAKVLALVDDLVKNYEETGTLLLNEGKWDKI